MKIIKTIWKLLEKLVMVAIILISIIIVTQRVSKNENAFLGFRVFRVETGSMIPKYKIGDVILVKETDINKIKVGDDVTYNGTTGTMKGKVVTHQVIEITEKDGKKVFKTKGIANNAADPLIYGTQIDGVVQYKLYIVTLICNVLSNRYIFYFCGVLPLTVWIFFAVIKGNIRKYEKMYSNNDDKE